MPQPDFSKLINLPPDSILLQLSRSRGEVGFLDTRKGIEKGLQWWKEHEPMLQRRVCATPGLKLLNDALKVASKVFDVLKDAVGEHRATYVAVLIAQQGLELFCKSHWDSQKGPAN